MEQIFQLHFRCNNQGDGSVRVDFSNDKEEITKIEEEVNETGEGWAESSVDTLPLKIHDGKIFFRIYEEINGHYQYVWKELQSKTINKD